MTGPEEYGAERRRLGLEVRRETAEAQLPVELWDWRVEDPDDPHLTGKDRPDQGTLL